jgi:uncharacterized protein
MERLRLSVPFTSTPSTTHQAASPGSDTRTLVRGMASVFGTLIDTWVPTRILRGAFAKTLRENGKRIRILWQHDQDQPIGIPTVLQEDERGLYLEALLSDTPRGREAAQLVKDGVISELSIGFDPVQSSTVEEMLNGVRTQVRLLSELKLLEVSLVTFAANPEAIITQVQRRRPTSMESLNEQMAVLDHAWERLMTPSFLAAQLRDLDDLRKRGWR